MNATKTARFGSLCIALALVVFGSSAPVEAQHAGAPLTPVVGRHAGRKR
jgi:hypothetical protein